MKLKDLLSLLPESQRGNASTHNHKRVMISVALAIGLLYLALQDLNWRTFFDALYNAQYIYLPIIFFLSSVSFLLRALRLRVLLASEKKLPIPHVFWANMAGYLGNNILPARAGELVRTVYLAQQNNISVPYVLAIGLVERLMDLIALIVLGSLALSSMDVIPPIFQNTLRGVFIAGTIGVLSIFIIPYFGQPLGRLASSIPMLNEAYKIKLKYFLQQFLGGLKSLQNNTRIVQFIGFTALIWLLDAAIIVLTAYALNVQLLLSQAFVLLAALGLSSAIPSTPGYIGIYQFVAVTILAPFGISKADALAFIIISQIFGYLVIGFWGVLSLWQFNKHTQV